MRATDLIFKSDCTFFLVSLRKGTITILSFVYARQGRRSDEKEKKTFNNVITASLRSDITNTTSINFAQLSSSNFHQFYAIFCMHNWLKEKCRQASPPRQLSSTYTMWIDLVSCFILCRFFFERSAARCGLCLVSNETCGWTIFRTLIEVNWAQFHYCNATRPKFYV